MTARMTVAWRFCGIDKFVLAFSDTPYKDTNTPKEHQSTVYVLSRPFFGHRLVVYLFKNP